MNWREDLTRNLSLKISEKFIDPKNPINVLYHEDEGRIYITHQNVDYSFEFIDDAGNIRFVMAIKPLDEASRSELEKRVRDVLPSNTEMDKTSRYFTNYSIESNAEHLNFSCRIKRYPKTESDATDFRRSIWGEIIQRIMRGVYSRAKP